MLYNVSGTKELPPVRGVRSAGGDASPSSYFLKLLKGFCSSRVTQVLPGSMRLQSRHANTHTLKPLIKGGGCVIIADSFIGGNQSVLEGMG